MKEIMHIHDETAAYALNALPKAEVTAVEAHADHCPPCKKALHTDADTAQMLGLLVKPQAPPAYCKSALMERLEREHFLTTSTRRLRGRVPLWMPLALALTVLGVWNIGMQRRITAMQSELEHYERVQAVVVESEASRPLQPLNVVANTAQAKMFLRMNDSVGVVTIKNLPPTPPGKVYRVWVARENEQQACETFVMDHAVEQIMIHTPQSFAHYKWLMITMEDADTTGQPPPSDENTIFRGDL